MLLFFLVHPWTVAGRVRFSSWNVSKTLALAEQWIWEGKVFFLKCAQNSSSSWTKKEKKIWFHIQDVKTSRSALTAAMSWEACRFPRFNFLIIFFFTFHRFNFLFIKNCRYPRFNFLMDKNLKFSPLFLCIFILRAAEAREGAEGSDGHDCQGCGGGEEGGGVQEGGNWQGARAQEGRRRPEGEWFCRWNFWSWRWKYWAASCVDLCLGKFPFQSTKIYFSKLFNLFHTTYLSKGPFCELKFSPTHLGNIFSSWKTVPQCQLSEQPDPLSLKNKYLFQWRPSFSADGLPSLSQEDAQEVRLRLKQFFYSLKFSNSNTVLVFPELRTDGPVDQEHDGGLGDLELSRRDAKDFRGRGSRRRRRGR